MKRVVLLTLVTVVVGLLWTPLRADEKKSEPRYEGKPLAYWVERLQKCEKNEERAAAAKAIKDFGRDAEPAVPALIEMLDDHSKDFRWIVCNILANIGKEAKPVVPALARLLKEQKARDPEQVINCLAWIGPPAAEATPQLIRALQVKDLRASGRNE